MTIQIICGYSLYAALSRSIWIAVFYVTLHVMIFFQININYVKSIFSTQSMKINFIEKTLFV